MSSKNRALRALCISTIGSLLLAGAAGAATIRAPYNAQTSLHNGWLINPATQTRTLAGAPHRGAMRALHSWMSARAKSGNKLVYVSDQEFNEVNIYPAEVNNPAPVGQITSGFSTPDGLAVDSSGNLYVTNAGGSQVFVYPPGATTPSFTYTPGANPVSVAIDSSNIVYIAQGFEGCLCVSEYNIGGSSPLRTIALDETGGSPMDLGFDESGNLYVTLTNATVYEFAPGATTGTNLGLVGLNNPRGIGFSKRGYMAVADDILFESPNYLDTYLPGQTAISRQLGVGPQPWELQFAKNRNMYLANVSYGFYGTVTQYNFPKGTPINIISNELEQPLGVALTADVK